MSWKIVGQKIRKELINNKHKVACLVITKEQSCKANMTDMILAREVLDMEFYNNQQWE